MSISVIAIEPSDLSVLLGEPRLCHLFELRVCTSLSSMIILSRQAGERCRGRRLKGTWRGGQLPMWWTFRHAPKSFPVRWVLHRLRTLGRSCLTIGACMAREVRLLRESESNNPSVVISICIYTSLSDTCFREIPQLLPPSRRCSHIDHKSTFGLYRYMFQDMCPPLWFVMLTILSLAGPNVSLSAT